MAEEGAVITTDYAARIGRVVLYVERLLRHHGAVDRSAQAAFAENGWCRTTSGTVDGNGNYPAVITVPNEDATSWTDYSAVKLKPLNGETLATATRYPARPAGYVGSDECWVVADTPSTGGGGSSVTVEEVDGSPTGPASTIRTNQATGLRVASVASNIATLYNEAAASGAYGVIDVFDQVLGSGRKQAAGLATTDTLRMLSGATVIANLTTTVVSGTSGVTLCTDNDTPSAAKAYIEVSKKAASSEAWFAFDSDGYTLKSNIGGFSGYTGTSGGTTLSFLAGWCVGVSGPVPIGGTGSGGALIPRFTAAQEIADGSVSDTGTVAGPTKQWAVSQTTPSGITTQQDDYAPGDKVALFLTAGANFNLTGISGGSDGRVLHLLNIGGTFSITIKSDSASSSSGNKIRTPGQVDYALSPYTGCTLIYHNANGLWYLIEK